MTDQEEKKPNLSPDEGSTQPSSPDLYKLEAELSPSNTIFAPEKPIPAAASATTTQPNEFDIEASTSSSRHASGLNQPVKVSRSNRRGLFGRLTILAEVDDPKLYPRRTKWFITFVVAIAGMAAPLGSTIIFGKDIRLLIQSTPANHLPKRHSLKLRLTLKPPRRLQTSQSPSFY